MHETHHEIMKIREPPEPQEVMFYYSKTHIFTNLPGPLKVHKMSPKRSPKDPKRAPKTSRGPPKALRKDHKKL